MRQRVHLVRTNGTVLAVYSQGAVAHAHERTITGAKVEAHDVLDRLPDSVAEDAASDDWSDEETPVQEMIVEKQEENMKTEFNVVLDTREDGTKVWSAKCRRCDAVLVGEQAHEVPIIQVKRHMPASQFEDFVRQLRKKWEEARKTGTPVAMLGDEDDIEVITLPDHGLQRALDAHVEVCSKQEHGIR